MAGMKFIRILNGLFLWNYVDGGFAMKIKRKSRSNKTSRCEHSVQERVCWLHGQGQGQGQGQIEPFKVGEPLFTFKCCKLGRQKLISVFLI